MWVSDGHVRSEQLTAHANEDERLNRAQDERGGNKLQVVLEHTDVGYATFATQIVKVRGGQANCRELKEVSGVSGLIAT